ncbi:hypothetical protein EA114_19910 [Salmonella enterica subsp. enterica serovar 6,7:b:-]|nr:hypothetical protein [Salmonella enterica subsp. enterica serovar 6,7:b:-]EBH8908117.1 hypothetical protein [Salmonella enterica subsp. enterica serovar Santiago]EBH8944678.1 hypothetical protein [Salmonella enterica subsp. enterica serovar 6,7:b:-]EBH8968293.1 hypothetical protein [Salmonella enterica subsp. enterica serovar Santiago]MMQ68546.1 hypothetical protein [Salmonella enterica subsp. enterica serovar 6,7:b:-]
MQTQQDTIRQMAEYNHLLSQRATSYAFEINRLKTLVVRHATHVVRKRLLKSSRNLHLNLRKKPSVR